MVVADLPFGSYQASPAEALHASARFMREAGAHAVKLEGGQRVAHHVEELVAAGVPVMGHVGLTPQSVHALGGFRVQGRGSEAGERLADAHAKALGAAGAFAVVLEGIPSELGARITVHVVVGGQARFNGRPDEGAGHGIRIAQVLDAQRAVPAAQPPIAPAEALQPLEVRQHLLEAPPGVAEFGPVVEVGPGSGGYPAEE